MDDFSLDEDSPEESEGQTNSAEKGGTRKRNEKIGESEQVCDTGQKEHGTDRGQGSSICRHPESHPTMLATLQQCRDKVTESLPQAENSQGATLAPKQPDESHGDFLFRSMAFEFLGHMSKSIALNQKVKQNRHEKLKHDSNTVPKTSSNKGEPKKRPTRNITDVFKMVPYFWNEMKKDGCPNPNKMLKDFVGMIKEKESNAGDEKGKANSANNHEKDISYSQLDIDVTCGVPKTRDIIEEICQDVKTLITLEKSLNTFYSVRAMIDSSTRISQLLYSGSTEDGFSTPRCFNPDDSLEVELDLMYIMGTFPKEFQQQVEGIDQKDNIFVRLFACELFECCLNEQFLSDISLESLLNDKNCVDPEKFKKTAINFLKANSKPQKEDDECFLASGLKVMSENTKQFEMLQQPSEKQSELASTTTLSVRSGNQVYAVSMDHVIALKVNHIPEFLRKRLLDLSPWLDRGQIDQLMDTGCHIVPKSSKHGNPDEEWRYSFSMIENQMIKQSTGTQQTSYYLFKALFYKYIKPIGKGTGCDDKTVFHSYIVKTTMFWMCEKYPPTHQIWLQENLFECLKLLVDTLENSVSKKPAYLPNFFTPRHNLLEGIDQHHLNAACQMLCHIKSKVMFYIPFNIKEVVNKLENTHNTFFLNFLVLLAVNYSLLGTYFSKP